MDINYKLLDKKIMPQKRISLLAIIVAFVLTLLTQYISNFFINAMGYWWGYAIAIIGVLFIHEGLHGLSAYIIGAKPHFGFKWFFAYTTFPERITREAYFITAITPLIIISTISILLLWFWEAGRGFTYFAFIVNLAGCVGDLWIVLTLLLYPKGALIQDTDVGYDVYIA